MKPSRWSSQLSSGTVVLLSALWLVGCANEQPTSSDVPDIFAAKAGEKGKPGSGEDPTVDGVDPNAAPQDTTLDVHVFGSGYDRGSMAELALDGVVTEKVKTNRTKFVSSAELIANITIALDAETALYDVLVTTSRGRKGIGTEMFEVKEKGKPNFGPAITIEFTDDPADNIQSDGRGIYVDRECGVSATFNLTDARLDAAPAANKIHPKEATACGGRDPRVVKVALTQPADGSPPHSLDGTTADGKGLLVDEVELVLLTDGTVQRTAVMHGPFGCALGLQFNPNKDSKSNFVDVTQNADGSWTVTTQPAANDVAVCLPDENNANAGPPRYYHLPFEITVRLK